MLTAIFLALVTLGHELRAQTELPRQQQSEKPDSDTNSPEPSTPAKVDGSATEQADQSNREPNDDNEWLHPSTLTNIGLICAALWAGFIALRTLDAIQKQTTQTDNHIKLVHQQWLDTANWNVQRVDEPALDYLSVTFDVINPTNMAVTITQVTVARNNKAREIFEVVANTLGPGRAYPITLSPYLLMGLDRIPNYIAGTLRILVTGSVTYVDAFGDERTQHFGRVCIVGHKTAPRFLVVDQHLYDPEGPEDEDDDPGNKPQEPNT